MRIVLDTNILWISIPNSSPSNWLIHDLLAQRYTLCVTTDILEEYEEIIERFLGLGPRRAKGIVPGIPSATNRPQGNRPQGDRSSC